MVVCFYFLLSRFGVSVSLNAARYASRIVATAFGTGPPSLKLYWKIERLFWCRNCSRISILWIVDKFNFLEPITETITRGIAAD